DAQRVAGAGDVAGKQKGVEKRREKETCKEGVKKRRQKAASGSIHALLVQMAGLSSTLFSAPSVHVFFLRLFSTPSFHASFQYCPKYRSSSHSLTCPMYSCHSSRLASR